MNNYTLDRSVQKAIQALLGWTVAEWAEYQYACGLQYLTKLAPEYPQVVTQISRSIIFWNWWKLHWEKRDIEFQERLYGDEDKATLVDEYRELHDPRTLAAALYLNGQVLQESYAEMIGKITKTQKEVAA